MSPKGRTMNCDVAEFWKMKDGRLESVTTYFDTAALNNFLTWAAIGPRPRIDG
ncbi:MAG: hypothetical protein JRN06_09795 [Nitrososphaerota archaeon]|nr:hypothetical protein [Nitrososphaerota archaeon]MDG7024878.1 hypothetical protein [Nitrososphaerota archaeon]